MKVCALFGDKLWGFALLFNWLPANGATLGHGKQVFLLSLDVYYRLQKVSGKLPVFASDPLFNICILRLPAYLLVCIVTMIILVHLETSKTVSS
jgi:hypothetical protein